jgi:murein L,D-transpeptidase YafK
MIKFILAGFLLAVFLVGIGRVQIGNAQSFAEKQKAFPRVRAAAEAKDDSLKALFATKHLAYPPKAIFIRAFKLEKVLEVWTLADSAFVLLKSYPVCASSGELGPKRQVGDEQVPEGFYTVSVFNPSSNYHLSLGINYPNASDRILGNRKKLGGDIMIHGDCVTIGCLPLTDDGIREVYWLAVQAKSNGQAEIPVHLFPARLTAEQLAAFRKAYPSKATLISFWENLQDGYEWFERTKQIPRVTVDADGRYVFSR